MDGTIAIDPIDRTGESASIDEIIIKISGTFQTRFDVPKRGRAD